jgi:hypothetical protein
MQGSCEDYFEAGAPELYYVDYAAVKFNGVMNYMQNHLQSWVIKNGFDANSIVDDFTDDESAYNPLTIISSALGIGSSFGGPASPALGVASGLFGLINQLDTPEEDDPVEDVRTAIAHAFDKAADQCQTMLNNAFGVQGANPDALPLQTAGAYNDHPISRFFADGKWIMHDVDLVVSPDVEAANALMSNGIVINMLASQGYFVFIDTDTSEDDCVGESQTWVNGNCNSLVERVQEQSCITEGSCPYDITRISEERWDLLINETKRYKMNEFAFFANAYECRQKHPDGKGKISQDYNTYFDQKLSECFYNIPVRKGTFDMDSGISDDDD